MKKVLIFGAGFLVGVVTGTVVTVLCYDHQKKKQAKEEVKTEKEPISTDIDEMRRYYVQGLRDLGFDILDTNEEDAYDNSVEEEVGSYRRSTVNPVDDEEEEESEEETDTNPIEPNPEPYEIPSHVHGNKEFYDTEVLQYYQGDGQMTDANYDFVDDWQQHVGYIEDRLKTEKADSIYIRNEVEQTDYEILIYSDSYAHAIEGEPLGDMAD